MKIAIIGTGYVGLVSGACFSDFGHEIICADLSQDKIDALKAGKIPIYEPGLEQIVAANSASGRLAFTIDVATAVQKSDVVFIAVGTPSRASDGHADLQYVYAAARIIAGAMDGYTVVATKSTVPVGTSDEIERIILKANPDAEFSVVSNPEFLREGAAIEDFKRPDRIVVGVEDDRARAVMSEVYRPLFLNRSPVLFVSRRTSELIKYASNGFLAVKISFINEIADLCEVIGANVQDVARGIGFDNRIGSKFLNAGPGYGGSCLPKDTLALVKMAQDNESPVRLIETAVNYNDNRKRAMARKVIAACEGDVRGKTIAILGLTFKPNTDDMREASSISIVRALQDAGASIRAYDPEGMKAARKIFENVVYTDDAYEAAQGADALVIVTEWDVFRALDISRLAKIMKSPTMIDLRNIYRSEDIEKHDFNYSSVGRSGLV